MKSIISIATIAAILALQFPAMSAKVDLKLAGINLAICKSNLPTGLQGKLARRSCDRKWLKTVKPSQPPEPAPKSIDLRQSALPIAPILIVDRHVPPSRRGAPSRTLGGGSRRFFDRTC